MASRNSRKIYLENTHYHAYNKGVGSQKIFRDNEDYDVFQDLFKRYLSRKPASDKKRRAYPWLYNDVELLAYCLMPDHFQLLVYQMKEASLANLLKNICGTYTTYFNKKYQRAGPLFQDRFKAVIVDDDAYLHHVSRYIHRIPKEFEQWRYSSLAYYNGAQQVEWLHTERILEQFATDRASYIAFVRDLEDQKEVLPELRSQLAHSTAEGSGSIL